ncbi:hypothetical protein [Odoribacter lunatus]|uniref:hypothetical protein n=1 Tax=Odoribacter lunatus TaxID=2941335 RepID=UPI00203BCB6E|nr:hypothetical protein [Odoribacter lunatus]
MRGVLGGYGYHGGTVNLSGYGDYWSSTWSSTISAYLLSVNSATVNPQYSFYKYWGFAVRCVEYSE